MLLIRIRCFQILKRRFCEEHRIRCKIYLHSLVTRLQQDGKDVEVSPFALMHGNYELPEQIREKMIHYAIRELKNKQLQT